MGTKMKRMIAMVFAVLTAFSLFGCKDKSGQSTQKPQTQTTTPTGTVTPVQSHYYNGGLHKISVTPTDMTFIEKGATQYTLIVPANADDKTKDASTLIRTHIKQATGSSLYVENDDTASYSDSAKYIVLGSQKLFKEAGLAMPTDDIGQTGYYITTKGDSVFIATKSNQGIFNGAINFLRYTIGYEMYSDDTVSYSVQTGDTVKLPKFEIIEKPDMEFYVPSNSLTSTARNGMGFLSNGDVFIPVGGLMWHNSFAYLDPMTYRYCDETSENYHPEWFSVNERKTIDWSDKSKRESGTGVVQLCYTARGVEAQQEAMLNEVMKTLTKTVDKNVTASNVTLTIQDNDDMCTCEACEAEKEKYGTYSASVIKFCNKLSAKLDAYLAEKAEKEGTAKREVRLLFFAYASVVQPPSKTENGKVVPIDDSVVCAKNVGVYLAPIGAAYNKSFYDEANITVAKQFDGWNACSDNLFLWLYQCNFDHYLYPLNNYDSLIETYRYCVTNGAVFMYNEGQWNNGHNVTAFAKFKEYIDSKALFNVNVNYNTLCDNFFNNYFREAATPMRKYFNELQIHLKELEVNYPGEIAGTIRDNMSQSRFWPKRTLEQWLAYMDEAYKAVEKYKESDPSLYTVLCKHITNETVFPRFALIELYYTSYAESTLYAMRKSFKEDCDMLGVKMYREAMNYGELEKKYEMWGLN